MKKVIVVFAVLFSMFGAAACQSVEDDVRQRAGEEVDRQRQRVEDRVDEEIERGRTQLEEGIEEATVPSGEEQ